MKVTASGKVVPSHIWYFVLDFRDRTFDTFEKESSISVTKKLSEYTDA